MITDEITDDILKCLDNKKVAIAPFMDLSEAYDCIKHDILLTKLSSYSVNFNELHWIKRYVSTRQKVVTRNIHLH